jgi:D-arabinose 1-dehydrogenase-like Zn-dependent alcohol dehydrogenase
LLGPAKIWKKRSPLPEKGKVTTHFSWDKLSNINAIFDRMEHGGIDGRIVLRMRDIEPSK